MIEDYMIGEDFTMSNELEWAAFIFSVKGEDIYYVEDAPEVWKTLKEGKPGIPIVNFLNHMGMRLSKKEIPPKIDDWYNSKGKLSLDKLEDSIIKIDLNNEQVVENIIKLYDSLDSIPKINDTSASKILHVLKPDLFVMWDNEIRRHFSQGLMRKTGSNPYIHFLKIMQQLANSVYNTNPRIDEEISLKLKKLYEGNLSLLIDLNRSKEIIQTEKIIEFMGNVGKSIAKYLDEYNWAVLTKLIALPPLWSP